MTHEPNPHSAAPSAPRIPRAPRSNAEYRWTGAKALAFLEALAESGEVAAAARQVGMSRQSAYRLKARMGPGAFARGWAAAQRLGRLTRVTGKVTGWGPR